MCDLATVLTVASGVMEHNAQVKAANAQNERYKENARNARIARDDENRAVNRRLDQEADAANAEKMKEDLESLKKQGTARTAAGESNVSGGSVSALLRDIQRTGAVEQNTIDRNFDMVKQQSLDQKAGIQSSYVNRVNSVQKGYAPSIGQSLGKIGVGVGTNFASTHTTLSAGQKNWGYKDTAKKMWSSW